MQPQIDLVSVFAFPHVLSFVRVSPTASVRRLAERLAERKECDAYLRAKAFDIVPFTEGMNVFDSKFVNIILPVTGEHSSRLLGGGNRQGNSFL